MFFCFGSGSNSWYINRFSNGHFSYSGNKSMKLFSLNIWHLCEVNETI